MRFHTHKRRATPPVIIVALIDVLIVLLIFLMVTTTFKQQQSLRLNLPVSTQAKKAGASDKKPLTVSINPDGIYFLSSVGDGKTPVTLEQLQAELSRQAASDLDLTLNINADEKAPWGRIVKVRDAAAAANIKTLVALTKPKGS